MSKPEVDGTTTAETVKWIEGGLQEFTIKTAEEVLKSEVARGAFTNTPLVVTDGVVGRDYHGVRSGGRIEFIAKPDMADAVLWAYEQVVSRSPVRSGDYQKSHFILINGEGQTQTSARTALLRAKPGDRVQIVNIQPYARKIEGQRAKRRKQIKRRRGLSRQAPSGVYRVVVGLVIQRWGRALFVDYKLQALDIGGITAVSKSAKHRSGSGFYTYPVLQFYMKS